MRFALVASLLAFLVVHGLMLVKIWPRASNVDRTLALLFPGASILVALRLQEKRMAILWTGALALFTLITVFLEK